MDQDRSTASLSWISTRLSPATARSVKKADLVNYRNNIEKAQTRLTSMIRSGAPKDDISKAMTDEYHLSLMFGGIDPFIAEFK